MDADTAIGGSAGMFPATRLSLLEAVGAGGSVSADALEQIAALYWKPVYRFVRLKFRLGNEDAKDLTQSFFASALERSFFERFDPARASFRGYLRMAVERFAATAYESAVRLKRGGGVEFQPVEDHHATVESPEAVFDQEWRRQVFALALDDLRQECVRSGKGAHWGVFEAYDLTEGARPPYAALAAQYGIAETQVTNYLAWARRTLRGLVQARLRGVTSGSRELREEMRRVWN